MFFFKKNSYINAKNKQDCLSKQFSLKLICTRTIILEHRVSLLKKNTLLFLITVCFYAKIKLKINAPLFFDKQQHHYSYLKWQYKYRFAIHPPAS